MAFVNKKDGSVRDFITTAVIGDKAQGKSSLIAEIVKAYMEEANRKYDKGLLKRPRKVLIHDPSEARAFKQFESITIEELEHGVELPNSKKRFRWERGIRRITSEDDGPKADEVLLKTIKRVMRNGMVVFDEARDWMGYTPTKWQKELITKHRNLALDVMMVFHNWGDVPKSLRPHIWQYIIFKSPEKPESPKFFIEKGFPNPRELFDKYKEVEEAKYYKDKIIQEYRVFFKTFDSVFKNEKK